MLTALDTQTDIRTIAQLLPKREIQHMQRVGVLVDLLACHGCLRKIFEKCPAECDCYGKAAAYHDIGKAWIPTHILTKPGKFSEAENAVVCLHPLHAKRLFERENFASASGINPDFVRLMMDCAVFHHERWDGKGYPFGLKHDAIPLIARLTAICDAYDAMTSNRTYRKAHTHDYAYYELEKNAGYQFDPELVKFVLENEQEITNLGRQRISDLIGHRETKSQKS